MAVNSSNTRKALHQTHGEIELPNCFIQPGGWFVHKNAWHGSPLMSGHSQRCWLITCKSGITLGDYVLTNQIAAIAVGRRFNHDLPGVLIADTPFKSQKELNFYVEMEKEKFAVFDRSIRELYHGSFSKGFHFLVMRNKIPLAPIQELEEEYEDE